MALLSQRKGKTNAPGADDKGRYHNRMATENILFEDVGGVGQQSLGVRTGAIIGALRSRFYITARQGNKRTHPRASWGGALVISR